MAEYLNDHLEPALWVVTKKMFCKWIDKMTIMS